MGAAPSLPLITAKAKLDWSPNALVFTAGEVRFLLEKYIQVEAELAGHAVKLSKYGHDDSYV
jgi:hypothetical protein